MTMKRASAAFLLTLCLLRVPSGAGLTGGTPGDIERQAVSEDIQYAIPNTQYEKALSLGDCVKFAIKNSFEVKLAKLDLYIAETDLMYSQAVYDTILAGGASYAEDKRQELSVFASDNEETNAYHAGIEKTLPTGTGIKADLSDTRLWQNTAFVSKNPSHNAELSFELTQPVGKNFFGYVDRTNVSITKLAVKNADLLMQDRIEALIADVEKAYWALVHAKRALEIYRGILEKAEKLHDANKKNFDIGLIEKGDLLASEANVARIKAETLIYGNDYKKSGEDLKLLMNTDGIALINPSDDFCGERVDGDLAYYLKKAFLKRRDYLIKKREAEIKGLNLKMKSNDKWPEIDLTASLSMNGIETDPYRAVGKTVVMDNTYYYAGVEVKIPLENREAESAFLKAGHEKESALLSLKNTERAVITEVANAYNDTIAYGDSLAYVRDAVKLQSGKLDEEGKRFAYGRSSTKTLIDYQNDLLRAELEEVRYLRDNEESKVALERAVNSVLDKYEGAL